MRKLIVSEFVSLDGVIQAPGGPKEDTDGGFQHGGWTWPYWHDDIGATFGEFLERIDALLLGRRTYVIHADAFAPKPEEDPFGSVKKYVVSRTLQSPKWKDTTVIRGDVIESVRALKAEPGKDILTDGSSQLVHALIAADLVDELHLLIYPVILGSGKKALPEGAFKKLSLKRAKPYPSGVVGLHYEYLPS